MASVAARILLCNNNDMHVLLASPPALFPLPSSLSRLPSRPFLPRLKGQPFQSWRGTHFYCMSFSHDENNNKEEDAAKDDAEIHKGASSGKDADSPSSQTIEEPLEVASGSPLPGMKASGEIVRIPKNVVDVIRDQVFGFDTFFVTSQEPYEGGVLFKGNLRGDASKSYAKINSRLQDKFGDQYKVFLLFNPEDDKPVAVVTPKQMVEPDPSTIPEWLASSLFGLVTIFTILLRNSPSLQLNFLSTFGNYQLLLEGLPGAFVTFVALAAHEAGHIYAAQSVGAKLGIPYLIPSWQLGAYGGITRITSILSKRQDLLKIAVAGPLSGAAVAFIILMAGLIFPPIDGQGIIVNANAFHDSFIVGAVAKIILGDSLKDGINLAVNPLLLWAWAGLLINGINSIPVGELDGGRISQALWGRKVWSRVNGVSIALLGFSALFSDVALYWVVLVLFLQRGPITPQSEEITSPDNKHTFAGVGVLFLALLICLPFPVPFS